MSDGRTSLGRPALPRRSLLAGTGGLGLGLALGACSGSSRPQASAYAGDYRLVALAAALENQAADFYRVLLAAERGGKLGAAEPALVSVAATCLEQHVKHARAWNSVLRAAHRPVIAGVPLSSHSALMSSLRSAGTPGAAAVLAHRLEDQAAQTFAAAAGHLANAEGVAAAASIAPVEAMHAAILRFMLGETPVPASFAGPHPASHRDLTV